MGATTKRCVECMDEYQDRNVLPDLLDRDYVGDVAQGFRKIRCMKPPTQGSLGLGESRCSCTTYHDSP